jgi:hypothetical protein
MKTTSTVKECLKQYGYSEIPDSNVILTKADMLNVEDRFLKTGVQRHTNQHGVRTLASTFTNEMCSITFTEVDITQREYDTLVKFDRVKPNTMYVVQTETVWDRLKVAWCVLNGEVK